MNNTITVGGRSDDNVSITGAIEDEIGCYLSGRAKYLHVSDGTVVKVTWFQENHGQWVGDGEELGWWSRIHKIGEGAVSDQIKRKPYPDENQVDIECKVVAKEPIRWAYLSDDPDGPDANNFEMIADNLDTAGFSAMKAIYEVALDHGLVGCHAND